MLPDLRIVIVTVISTFVLTVGVGFYASSRMMQESKKRTDLLATLEETPVNRIALSWPEPMRQSEPLALDFAVTARALRNPVRDVTNEPAPAEARPRSEPQPERQPEPQLQPEPVRTAATDVATSAATDVAKPAADDVATPPADEAEAVTPAEIKPAPVPAKTEQPEPAPEPDIRVAVQYPPVVEFPPELRAPTPPVIPMPVDTRPAAAQAADAQAADAQVTDAKVTDTPATTGSVAESPKEREAADIDAAPPAVNQREPVVALRSDPAIVETEDENVVEQVPIPRAAPKVRARKAAPKRAVASKAAKRPARRAAPARATNGIQNFFNSFTSRR